MKTLRTYLIIFLQIISANIFAQTVFQDNFNDGDFLNNPAWSGDITKYTVTGANNELRLNDLGNGGSSTLYVPINIQDSTVWEFLIKTNLTTAGPSSSNRIRVYLQANTSNFASATLNGYYLQIGETGSLDAIEIYKVTNGTSTRIIRGTDATVAGAVINSRIKIVRNNSGLWELLTDHTGGTNFTSEGTVTDNSHNSGTHFGVFTTYTTTQGDRFFYDDFNISPLFVDNVPPLALSATAINANTVDVLFNEALDPVSAALVTNYALNNGINISSAVLDAINPALVHLTVSNLTNLTSYQLDITDIADLNNNILLNQTLNFSYQVFITPAVQEIIFNEIMIDPNPVVNLPDAEYVELYNRSSGAVDLNGYSFVHRSASSGIETIRTLGSYVLLPGEYVLLHNFVDYLGLGNDLQVSSFPALNNTSAYLLLKTPSGNIIDSILYEFSWYRDATKDDGGWSIELINQNELCKGSSNWIASNDLNGGTPGLQNSVNSTQQDQTAPTVVSAFQQGTNQAIIIFSETIDPVAAVNIANYSVNGALNVGSAVLTDNRTVLLTFDANMQNNFNYTINITNIGDCLGNVVALQAQFTYVLIQTANFQDLIFNELMIDPTPVVSLPNAEFIELYNRSAYAIDLSSYTLSHRSATSSTTTSVNLGTYVILPGEYVVLHNSTDYTSAVNDLLLSPFPALNNTSAYIILKNANGDLVDSILYSADWYQDTNKDDGGWTLELINPNLVCKNASNWIASNNPDGGTPGAVNSVLDNSPDTLAPSIIQIQQLDVNQIYVIFDDVLDPSSAQNLSNYNISPFNQAVFARLMDEYTVEITFSANFIDDSTYTLTALGIKDCIGNIDTVSASFEYLLLSPASHYDIIINEILSDANPSVGLPEKEFVELYNRSDKNIALQGFRLSDETSTVGIFPYYILKPQQYLIIQKAGEPNYNSFGNVLEFDVFPDLDATEDLLVLSDNLLNVIDAVEYSTDWHSSSSKAEGGWTLERINPNRPCEGFENWTSSVAQPPLYPTVGGSPGRANSVLQTLVDNLGPELLRAYPFATANSNNGDSIRLFFSEAIGDSAALDLSNYSINNGLTITNVMLERPGYNSVVIITNNALVDGTRYTVRLSNGFTDCIGNPIFSSDSAVFAKPSAIDEGDIIINEILFNPVSGGSDYLELYNNTSNKVLNIGDLWISNASDQLLLDANDVKTDYLLFPGDYIVLSPSTLQIYDQYSIAGSTVGPNLDKMIKFSLPTFDDKEGTAIIYTVNNNLAVFVDSLYFSEDYQSPFIDDLNGVALERIDFDAPSNDKNNWYSAAQSIKFGTPTYRNSSAYTNEIIDDGIIQLGSNTLSPDSDGFEDFLLINYNIDAIGYVGNIAIYDAQGRFIKQLVNNELLMQEGTIQWDGSNEAGEKCIIGPYIIFAEIFNPDGKVKRYKKTCILAAKF
jgi:hypothetical protein